MSGREPWIKLKVGTRRSGKLASLPSDSARLGYVWLLLEAKVQRRLGVFDNRAHMLEVLGRFGRFLDGWIAAGLVHEAPALCDDCKPRNTGLKRGQLVVHDYSKEQRDPTNADRQADYRANHVTPDDALEPEPRNGDRNAPRNASRNGTHNADVAPTVTPDSRARGTTVTVTTTESSRKDHQDLESEAARMVSADGTLADEADEVQRPGDPDAERALPW